MTPQRLAAERLVLQRYFPSLNLNETGRLTVGTLVTNAGNRYSVAFDIPASFPDSPPTVFVTDPVLTDFDGDPLYTTGVSSTMHTLGPRGTEVQICHSHPNKWHAHDTLYQVALKVRLWLEAYELHLRFGQNLDHFLPHA